MVSIPMADVWQDDAWREQQRKLLTAQFGPKEVEVLSMNAVLPITLQSEDQRWQLEWMQCKELHELQASRRPSLPNRTTNLLKALWSQDVCRQPRRRSAGAPGPKLVLVVVLH